MSTEEPGENSANSANSAALTYRSYLALDEILGAQRPRSAEHDEMLFIVIHQVYELWFKQLLHEFGKLQRGLADGDTPRALHALRRILTILKVIVAQIDVLETMTPRQFTSFRSRLEASSGFQSAQFRELEAMLGRRDFSVLNNYPENGPEYARISAAMNRPSIFDAFLRYLTKKGYVVPEDVLNRDVRQPAQPSKGVQRILLEAYADEGNSTQVAERLVDVDEGLQEWRYRHVMMVQRTIGDKSGTGGSSGADYLRGTLFRPFFADLWAVRSQL